MAIECPPVGELTEEEVSDGQISDELVDTQANEPIPRPRAAGKMKTVVDADQYQEIPAERTKQGLTPFTHRTEAPLHESGQQWINYQSTLADRFRYVCQTHWGKLDTFTQDDRGVLADQFRYINSGFFERDNRTNPVDGVPFVLRSVSDPVQVPPLHSFRGNTRQVEFLKDFYKKQTIWIEPRDDQYRKRTADGPEYVQSYWDLWVRGGTIDSLTLEGVIRGDDRTIEPLFNVSREFLDHSFRMTAPMFPREIQELNGLPRPAIAKVDMEYNFYVKEYEQALDRIKNSGLELEHYLPSMYVFLTEKKSKNLDTDQSIFHRHITLNGHIDNVSVDVLNERGEKIGEKDKGQYFDKWGRSYNQLITSLLARDSRFIELTSKYKRILFSPLDMENLKSFNEKRFLFPMYIDMQFSTDRRTLLADAMKEAQLGTAVMRAAAAPPRESEDDPAYRPNILPFRIATETVTVAETTDKIVTVNPEEQRMVLDVGAWWNSLKRGEIQDPAPSVILGTSLPELFVSEQQQNAFVRTIVSTIFSGKLRNVIKDRLRTFEDIMNGKHAYSETVFYKISKHRINEATGQPFPDPDQDFFVPNDSELDIFRFVDTQVVYDRKYKYIVYAYELVFGTAYQYIPNRQYMDFTSGKNAVIDVYTRPSIQLIETPLLDFETKVADKAPLPPDVNLVPYKSVNDKLLINLNAQVGELKAQPITLSEQEVVKVREERLVHDLDQSDPLEYKGDDPIDFFEVFRTTRKPRSYDDFRDRLHKEAETEILQTDKQDTGLHALSSASLIDNLRPNVTYYYMFRAVDIHGNVSNPTAVYRVQLVDENGLVFPIIELFDFELPKTEENKATFNKFIHIAPSVLQEELNIVNDSDIQSAHDAEVELGMVEDRIFAKDPSKKKIKLRITSKQTGKSVDINLNFSHKHTS